MTDTRTMKAAAIRRFGGPDRVNIEEVARPVAGPDEVLIRVHASTVSVADYRARSRDLPRGLAPLAPLVFGFRTPRNPVLGMDVAGVVDSVGADVTRFAVGDHVIAVPGGRFGGHAEYVTMKQDAEIALAPAGWSHEDSVALLFGGVTVVTFLHLYPLAPGMKVLVNGASGSTGSSAVQIAKHFGAEVTGVTTHRELVLSLGADRVIDYRTTDFTALGEQWDVIFDCVGNAPYSRVSRSLARGGALLLVIADLASMLSARRSSRHLGGLVTYDKKAIVAADLEFLASLASSGELKPVIERIYEFDEIREAHERVGTKRKVGTLVVRV